MCITRTATENGSRPSAVSGSASSVKAGLLSNAELHADSRATARADDRSQTLSSSAHNNASTLVSPATYSRTRAYMRHDVWFEVHAPTYYFFWLFGSRFPHRNANERGTKESGD